MAIRGKVFALVAVFLIGGACGSATGSEESSSEASSAGRSASEERMKAYNESIDTDTYEGRQQMAKAWESVLHLITQNPDCFTPSLVAEATTELNRMDR